MVYNIKVNFTAFKYIPLEYKEQCYLSMVIDIYYFYYNNKPKENEMIICIDGNQFNLNKENLKIVSK